MPAIAIGSPRWRRTPCLARRAIATCWPRSSPKRQVGRSRRWRPGTPRSSRRSRARRPRGCGPSGHWPRESSMLEQAQPRGLGERLLALRSFPLLASLPSAELGLLARRSRERDYRAGETLAVEGEPVDTIHLLVSGRAALLRAGMLVETAGASTSI